MTTEVSTAAGRLDAARAVVLPGPGAVVRLPGLLGLLCLDAVDTDTVGHGHLARLVEICTEASATRPSAPGRPLAWRLARWLGSLAAGPALGTVSATESGVALFLHGAVDAVLGGQRYSAAESGAWLDRLLPHPDGPLVLLPTDGPVPEDPVQGVFDLRGGVVPAGAVVVLPRSGARPGPVARSGARPASMARLASMPVPVTPEPPAPTASPAIEPTRTPVPVAGARDTVATPANLRHASAILGVVPDEPPRVPLDGGTARTAAVRRPSPHRRTPVEPAAPRHAPADGPTALFVPDDQATVIEPRAARNGAPVAYGFRCSRDHLNDPRSHFCTICGIRMDQRTGVIQAGVRPPLGLLVFDDGATYTVDADYLLGRTPETDPRVLRGQLRALPVDDPESQLSSGHLVIKLDGWDVTAIDESRNGTLMARTAEESWSRLTPRQPLRLLPGTRVRVGGRRFVFESPSGVR